MNIRPFAPIFAALVVFAGFVAPAFAAETFVTLIEAEVREINHASITITSSPEASGAAYANNPTAYHPLFSGEWPAEEAERLTIWARIRGHAIQLKALDGDGKQTEFDWEWSRPSAWRWINLGTYERIKLGVGFIIIRSEDASADAGLDALIVTNDPNFRPRDPQP